jgi:hypothetical protein
MPADAGNSVDGGGSRDAGIASMDSGGPDAGTADAGIAIPRINEITYYQQLSQSPNINIISGGLDYKVFFEFANVDGDLTPAEFETYSALLADAGFEGDAKLLTDPQLSGQSRFQYNDIIVHGHSIADGEIAERVGLSLFGTALTGYGRGLDVGPPYFSPVQDWHSFLCAVRGDTSSLPLTATQYVNFQN